MRPAYSRRRGTTFLELQVALVVFSIAVAGLCPLVVMQSRLLRKIETEAVGTSNLQVIRGVRMLNGQPAPGQGFAATPPTTVLQPQPDAWVRRLGIAATFRADAPSQGFTPMPVITTTDDLDAGFSAPSAWNTSQNTAADNGGYHSLPAASSQGPAVWTFAGLTPGRYHINVSWVPSALNAKDATYTFNDGAGRLVSTPANQTTGPGGTPPYWTDLGVYYLGTTFQISLGPALTGRVVADAVQLVPAGPLNTVIITNPAAASTDGLIVSVKVTGL